MPEEINTNDINSNEINEQILLNQDEKITETNQLLGATMQQNEERKQLSEAGLMAQEAIKEKMNGKPSIYVSTIIDAFLESLGEKLKGKDGQKGEKGEKGDMPKRGVDYFTPKDINSIQDYIQSQIRIPEDGYTPIKGKDYFTPKEIDTIVSQVRNLIPTPKDGRDGREATIDYDIIVKRVLSKIKLPAVKQLTAKEILDMVKGKIKYEDIKNTPTIFKQAGKMAGQGYFKDLADVNVGNAQDNVPYSLKRTNGVWGVEVGAVSEDHSSLDNLDYAHSGHIGFEPTVTKGNLTEATSSVLTISGGTSSVIGSGTSIQVKKASSTQDGYLSSTDWGIFNNKADALGYTAEDIVNKSTNVTTDGSSDTKYPSVKAVKTYADGLVIGALKYRGAYDASGNTYPVAGGSGTAGAVLKGDMWIISVVGTLGGEAVQVGDSIIANVDTPAQTASNWNHLNANVSYVPEDVANKETIALDTSTTKYPCNNVVKEAVDAKQNSLGYTAENVDNKVTSFQGTPDDTHYPSERLVKDQLDLKIGGDTSYGGTVVTDLDTITKTGFYTCFGIATGVPDEDYSWFVLHQNSNVGTVSATQRAIAYLAGNPLVYERVKIASTWGAWYGPSKSVQQYCVEWETPLTVKDGVGYIEILEECNGMNLISARARVGTAGTANTSTFDIYNVTDSHSMLSSAISIASGATSGTGTVDTAHDDVATGDIIRIDCDSISTTPPEGLIVTLSFRLI